MKLRYIYSACTVLETPDCRIVSDPWFTQGAYDGTWWQYPVVENPIDVIGPTDIVYISHNHPDHYDVIFLHKYLQAYPHARIVIPELKNNSLYRKMISDGFKPEVVKDFSVGDTKMRIWPNRYPEMPVDSAMVICRKDQVVVNVNDNRIDEEQIDALKDFSENKKVNLLMAPYTGAGPYPQTYYFETEKLRLEAERRKEDQFVQVFQGFMEHFDPIRALPFAGKYYLAGRLAHLNDRRGVIDPIQLRDRLEKSFADRVIIPEDGGRAYYDLDNDTVSAERDGKYTAEELDKYFQKISHEKLEYEREIVPGPARNSLPISELLKTAVGLAKSRYKAPNVPLLIFRIMESETVYMVFIEKNEIKRSTRSEWTQEEKQHPYFVEIDIDERYLFGLLTRLYRWSNAEIGSQYYCRRVPNVYEESFYSFLVMLHV
ncbi:MAG: MBL fold metallo-hydrolase [Acinetobacter sp.]|nr:MBL fold metallo-hydrolase [Acinetobacter sp.]